jgi:N-acetylglucosaminyldiphosphoundecaprenol N-acetyl-beta-D-mannosaminyltransferase
MPDGRINLLGVPLDLVDKELLENRIFRLLDEGGAKNIVLLSLWDFLRARKKGEYGDFVRGAALVIPISRSLVSGARFLGYETLRYMPFDFALRLLSSMEDRDASIYLLGSGKKVLEIAERNIVDTFPGLRVIGRHTGKYRKSAENIIITAIRKSAPSLLLVGKGVHGGEKWLKRHGDRLSPGLRMWCSDLFSVFAERRNHPSQWIFDHGLEWFGYCVRNPLKFFRVFPYLWYKMLLLGHKLFGKTSGSQSQPRAPAPCCGPEA